VDDELRPLENFWRFFLVEKPEDFKTNARKRPKYGRQVLIVKERKNEYTNTSKHEEPAGGGAGRGSKAEGIGPHAGAGWHVGGYLGRIDAVRDSAAFRAVLL
jgi:hypothetical protein